MHFVALETSEKGYMEQNPHQQLALSGGRIEPGALIAERYRLGRLLGKGGMGEVYLAVDLTLNNSEVALKILDADLCHDERHVKRFTREMQLTRDIVSPHVVRTFDLGKHGDRLFITMEYLSGETLDQSIETGIEISLLVDLLRQIALGLQAIHDGGIVHRDLKPANIMVTAQGVVKITDFGVARPQISALTAHSEVIGSAQYLAPEAWTGAEPGPTFDIYAFGVLAYQMVTGVLPIDGGAPAELMFKHMRSQIVPPIELRKSCPLWLSQLIVRMLAKAPDGRPGSAAEIVAEIETADREAEAIPSEVVEIDPDAVLKLFESTSTVPNWEEPVVAPPVGASVSRPAVSEGFAFIRREASSEPVPETPYWRIITTLTAITGAVVLCFGSLAQFHHFVQPAGWTTRTIEGALVIAAPLLALLVTSTFPWITVLCMQLGVRRARSIAAKWLPWCLFAQAVVFSHQWFSMYRFLSSARMPWKDEYVPALLASSMQRWMDLVFAATTPGVFVEQLSGTTFELARRAVPGTWGVILQGVGLLLVFLPLLHWSAKEIAKKTPIPPARVRHAMIVAIVTCGVSWSALTWYATEASGVTASFFAVEFGGARLSVSWASLANYAVTIVALGLVLCFLKGKASENTNATGSPPSSAR
jgi:serine/threonine protein kinase